MEHTKGPGSGGSAAHGPTSPHAPPQVCIVDDDSDDSSPAPPPSQVPPPPPLPAGWEDVVQVPQQAVSPASGGDASSCVLDDDSFDAGGLWGTQQAASPAALAHAVLACDGNAKIDSEPPAPPPPVLSPHELSQVFPVDAMDASFEDEPERHVTTQTSPSQGAPTTPRKAAPDQRASMPAPQAMVSLGTSPIPHVPSQGASQGGIRPAPATHQAPFSVPKRGTILETCASDKTSPTGRHSSADLSAMSSPHGSVAAKSPSQPNVMASPLAALHGAKAQRTPTAGDTGSICHAKGSSVVGADGAVHAPCDAGDAGAGDGDSSSDSEGLEFLEVTHIADTPSSAATGASSPLGGVKRAPDPAPSADTEQTPPQAKRRRGTGRGVAAYIQASAGVDGSVSDDEEVGGVNAYDLADSFINNSASSDAIPDSRDAPGGSRTKRRRSGTTHYAAVDRQLEAQGHPAQGLGRLLRPGTAARAPILEAVLAAAAAEEAEFETAQQRRKGAPRRRLRAHHAVESSDDEAAAPSGAQDSSGSMLPGMRGGRRQVRPPPATASQASDSFIVDDLGGDSHDFAQAHRGRAPAASGDTPFSGPAQGGGAVQHVGYACDGCGMTPLLGPRFSCRQCPEFDLCSVCIGSRGRLHDAGVSEGQHHVFQRLDHPVVSQPPSTATPAGRSQQVHCTSSSGGSSAGDFQPQAAQRSVLAPLPAPTPLASHNASLESSASTASAAGACAAGAPAVVLRMYVAEDSGGVWGLTRDVLLQTQQQQLVGGGTVTVHVQNAADMLGPAHALLAPHEAAVVLSRDSAAAQHKAGTLVPRVRKLQDHYATVSVCIVPQPGSKPAPPDPDAIAALSALRSMNSACTPGSLNGHVAVAFPRNAAAAANILLQRAAAVLAGGVAKGLFSLDGSAKTHWVCPSLPQLPPVATPRSSMSQGQRALSAKLQFLTQRLHLPLAWAAVLLAASDAAGVTLPQAVQATAKDVSVLRSVFWMSTQQWRAVVAQNIHRPPLLK